MHRFPDSAGFGQKVQEAELDYLVHSEAASRALAENYVGLALDFAEPETAGATPRLGQLG